MTRHAPRRLGRRLRHDDRGQITPWTIVGVLIVMILAGLVLDLGLGMSDKVRILDLAQAAARTGAREIDLATYRTTGAVQLDPTQATTAARAFLAHADVPGTATASTTTVTVTITTSRRTQLLNLVGITSLPVSATATATPLTGVTTAT